MPSGNHPALHQSVGHIRHHQHPGYSYSVHPKQLMYGLVGVPIFILIITSLILHPSVSTQAPSLLSMIGALFSSILRLLTAYALALVLSVPLALLIIRSTTTERLLLPAFDILQSIPVLAFFPVVIVFFIGHGLPEGAAVFIIFINMLWNLVFSLVGGLRLIPPDIKSVAKVFKLSRQHFLLTVLLPAVVPYVITGSLLAWAEGWNMLIVAEVLHTYLPMADASSDLFGIGSVMVHASASGQSGTFVGAVILMVLAIGAMNILVWQRLLYYSERFRFE